MAYRSKTGKRPNEYASKSAHTHIAKDASVLDFLRQCNPPVAANDIALPTDRIFSFTPVTDNPIKHVFAIDGSFDEVLIRAEFPSSTVCFFQFGALLFDIEDLDALARQPFIDPSDMARLKQIQRLKLTLPIRNISLKTEGTLTASIRRAIYDFFRAPLDGSESQSSLARTLQWLIFQEFANVLNEWTLSTCPLCGDSRIKLIRSEMSSRQTFICPHCGGEIFITDVFRLHEAIDDELGAGGILGYVVTAIEQIILAHLIRSVLSIKPSLLREILFIKDGPLAFFGQTANIHKPMKSLMSYLFDCHSIYLAGLEKSGAFVEHADAISQVLQNGTVLIPDDAYIYKYIVPGNVDPSRSYGSTTYYGKKIIFKALDGSMYVATLPMKEIINEVRYSDLQNADVLLSNIEKLQCDMYDNALMPVALANKLVSLSTHPSSKILQRFARDTIFVRE